MSTIRFLRNLSARPTYRSAPQGATGDGIARRLQVERHDGIIGLQALAEELDSVNEGSAKPSPFATSDFTIAYASNSERDPLGMDVRLFVVCDLAGKALGWAVFAFRIDQLGVVPAAARRVSPGLGKLLAGAAQLSRASRLELMTTSDVDRPGVVALAGCEDAVAVALLAHLIERELDWTLLEWRAQERGSALWRAAHDLGNPFLRVRDVELDPYSEVLLQWPDGAAYFRALSKRMRSNVSRQARKLYASGDVELVMVNGPAATEAFFDAYTDLESRSWKFQSSAAMGRHPLRKKFYSRIVSGQAGIEPSLVGIALDGVLIAALINGQFGDRMWSMEMAFDESWNELGPGQLLLLLAAMDALEKHCRSLNFFQMHGYFKRRWLADELPVVNVQVLRRPSLHDLRGLTGDTIRWAKTKAARRLKPSDDETAQPGSQEQTRTEQRPGDDVQKPDAGVPSGGFNAVKRAASSEKVSGDDQDGQGQGQGPGRSKPVDSGEAENLRRALFAQAVQRARDVNEANAANVRILDVAAASALLPFAVK